VCVCVCVCVYVCERMVISHLRSPLCLAFDQMPEKDRQLHWERIRFLSSRLLMLAGDPQVNGMAFFLLAEHATQRSMWLMRRERFISNCFSLLFGCHPVQEAAVAAVQLLQLRFGLKVRSLFSADS